VGEVLTTIAEQGGFVFSKKIDTHGSLKKAGECLGMSYRPAWEKIKATETNVGLNPIKNKGVNRGGYELTDEDRRLMAQYKSWSNTVEHAAVHSANEVFPFPVRPLKNRKILFQC